MLKSFKFWVGIAISVAAIWWAGHNIDWPLLGRELARFDYLWLIACLPIIWVQYVIRAIRWDYLLRPITKVAYRSRLTSTVLGFTGNLLLPLRLGEIIRAVDLGKRESISKASVLSTILLERVLDGLILIPILLISAYLLGVFQGGSTIVAYIRTTALFFSLAYVAVLVVVVVLALIPERFLALLKFLFKPLPQRFSEKLLEIIASLVEGLMLLRHPRLIVPAVAYTVLLWLMLSLPLYFMALGVGHKVSFTAAVFVQGLLCVAIAAPSAPGFVGTFHKGIQAGFTLPMIGMSNEKALTVAIVFHAATFVFTVAYGLTFVVRGRTSLFDLKREAEET